METFLICLLGFVCLFLFIKSKLKREQYQEQIRKEVYEKEKEQIVARIQEEVSDLSNEKKALEKELETKTKFNDSMLLMREDELDRIIQKEKEEKKKVLLGELETWRNTQQCSIDCELSTYTADTELKKCEISTAIELITNELDEFHLKRTAINEAINREKQLAEKEDFYRICIAETDKEDIAILEEICPRLRNREAISKLIWNMFFQKATNEMIKRVTCGESISGIYKITYIKTGEAYIGKTTNIQRRWQTHVKTALGLDAAAHATLHSRLAKDGIWNYTFEILEAVPKDKLTEREKFFIKLYDTTSQLNMREG